MSIVLFLMVQRHLKKDGMKNNNKYENDQDYT